MSVSHRVDALETDAPTSMFHDEHPHPLAVEEGLLVGLDECPELRIAQQPI